MPPYLLLFLCLHPLHGEEWLGQCVTNNGGFSIALDLVEPNKPEVCIQACRDRGYSLAGVQNIKECYCGSSSPPVSAILGDSECNYPCPGDGTQRCGGHRKANVFETKSKFSFYLWYFYKL